MRIFLIGFMGAGKSHWAARWAEKCGLTCVDLDVAIEEAEGKSIQQIFADHGEAYFRELEAAVLRKLGEQDDFIMACGGGTACFHHNLQWMQSKGRLIYLEATAAELWERLKKENQQRPLLHEAQTEEERWQIIEKLLSERETFYTQADWVLQVESLEDDTIVQILQTV